MYVVATPIGHLDDLGERARAVLAAVDLIAAEDTRHSGVMLSRLGIRAELASLHEHNEEARTPELIDRLCRGASIALISDAGTPALSDPGYRLVVAAHEAAVRVIPIPGPSAVTAALAAAGQPTDRFLFSGFLPARAAQRRQRLRELAEVSATLVVFESCHRLRASLADLAAAFGGDRPATLARELTKQFETVRRSTLADLAAFVGADPNQSRGEAVLVIAGASDDAGGGRAITLAAALDVLMAELPPARAAAVAARLTGVARRVAYQAAMARKAPD